MGKYDYFLQKKPTLLGRLTGDAVRNRVFKVISRLLAEKSDVLEIGPGEGPFAHWCRTNGHPYKCYDNNSSIVEHLASAGFNASLCTVPPLPDRNDSQTCIVMSHVLEHMAGPEQAYQLLKEIHRVLKPGGNTVIFVPDFSSWSNDFWEIDYTHSFVTAPYRIATLLDDAGFGVIFQKRLYASFGFFPGWFIDKIVRMVCQSLRPLLPLNAKLLKAKIMFHGNLLVVGRKKM